MAPKCAMSALPPPCEQLQNSMLDMGAEVSLDGLREYIDRRGNGLVHYAFNAYQRQLLNWWPETLLTRYNEFPRQRGADDARRHCLVRYLQSPSSGGFPRDVSSGLPGGEGADRGPPPEKVRRVQEAGIAGAGPAPSSGQHATPMKTTPVKAPPTQAFSIPQEGALGLRSLSVSGSQSVASVALPRRLRMCLGVRSPSVSDSQSAAGAAHP